MELVEETMAPTEAPFGVDKFGEKRLITHSWANAVKSIPCMSMNVQNVTFHKYRKIIKNHYRRTET